MFWLLVGVGWWLSEDLKKKKKKYCLYIVVMTLHLSHKGRFIAHKHRYKYKIYSVYR